MKRILASAVLVALGATAATADVVPVELEEIRHQRAELVIVGSNGETSYTAAELEGIGAHRMETITPWREQVTSFDGVLLTDLLAAHGIDGASGIRVTAENGYATEMEAEVWQRFPILLATRVNGKPHSRRSRGPIQFVLPMSDSPEIGDRNMGKYWVWMAARIEPLE